MPGEYIGNDSASASALRNRKGWRQLDQDIQAGKVPAVACWKLAEAETDSMSERQLAAKRHLAEAGFHHGGTPPLGWMAGPRATDEYGRSGVSEIVCEPQLVRFSGG